MSDEPSAWQKPPAWVAVDLDATLTDEPFRTLDEIPPPGAEGRRLLEDLVAADYHVMLYTGRVDEDMAQERRSHAADQLGAWIVRHGLERLIHRVWPWPKPYVKAIVDDRAVTWRGHAGKHILDDVKQADQHLRRPRCVLLIAPLSDRYNGIGNYGAPALGVWRIRANCVAAGHTADAWDCNLEPEVATGKDAESLVRAFYAQLARRHDLASYDWVGFSVLNDTLPLTLGLANLVRKEHPRLLQVAGNAEATLNYQDVLDKSSIDCVLVGEADFAMPRLVSGEDPRRIDGCIWFSRGRRMTPQEFARAYEPLDWGDMPWREYGRMTADLYGLGPMLDAWLDRGEIDPSLRPVGVFEEDAVNRIYSCMTVRVVTMDHCFLPCTYCLHPSSLVRTERGIEDVEALVRRGERIRVLQHDGSFGLATEFHRRPFDGDLVHLEVSGSPVPLVLTPEHGVRIDSGRSTPAGQLRVDDRVLAVVRGCHRDARPESALATVTYVGRVSYHGDVFNLGVEPLHTYVANGVVVDNCSTARIPDLATGTFQRSVFLPLDATRDLFLRIKRQVRGCLGIYDDSDETFLGTKRGLAYADMLASIRDEMDAGTPMGFRYLVQTRSNEMTRELIHRLAEVGVRHLTFGVENASAYVRDSLRKRQDDQKLLDIVDWCRDAGVTCYYLLILFPPETRVEDLETNVHVVREWVRRGAVVSAEPYLMPYRGTQLLDDPRYTYEHIAFDVPFSGVPTKRLKWPTLVWPRDPRVRGILQAYRATLDGAIREASKRAGHKHLFKGFTGRVCVEHLARVLDAYHAGAVKPWTGEDIEEEARVGAVYQEYFGQESGAVLRDSIREKLDSSMQSPRGRYNPTHSTIDVAVLKQGAATSRTEKDPAAPGEVVR